ncbi:MAG: hypothetical protein GX555_00885 [Actinomycetales bacterium]|nr:hypothetical protein [Actinomycetales bacterium]
MDDYITALDSTGLDVHGQKALRDLPTAVRQLVEAMTAKGWNWGVYTYPYQDGCGSRRRDVGGANPDTGDRVSFMWQSSWDLRRGWGGWTPYRLIVQESREGFGPVRHTTVRGALAFVATCPARAIITSDRAARRDGIVPVPQV